MTSIKVATFNLFHFAEPGIYWHELKPNATYTPEQWIAKTAWLTQALQTMNADVIGFQEVVSHAALKTIAADCGYAYFYNAGTPVFDETDSRIYVNATVAIASRYPLIDPQDLNGVAGVPDDTVIDDTFGFSRVPVQTDIDLPGIGKTRFYVCHFKSQGAFVDNDDIDSIVDWQEKIKTVYRLRADAGVDQVSKRAAEAGVLYRLFRAELDRDHDARVVLLGDLNEGPESHTLGILTQSGWVFSWGSIPQGEIPAAISYLQHVFRLYDAWMLAPSQTPTRPATHGGALNGSVLDYVIVSNGFNPKNPRRRATLTGAKVFNQHFLDGTNKIVSSDHAPVVVTIETLPQ